MRVVFDSSSFAKRFIVEPGSETVDEVLQKSTSLGLCVLCVPEIISALNRRLHENFLSKTDYNQAKAQLHADVHDATILQLTPDVIATSIQLLETNVLRSMDALHIACGLEWHAELFVSADHRQIEAAKNSGLLTQLI